MNHTGVCRWVCRRQACRNGASASPGCTSRSLHVNGRLPDPRTWAYVGRLRDPGDTPARVFEFVVGPCDLSGVAGSVGPAVTVGSTRRLLDVAAPLPRVLRRADIRAASGL